MNFDQDLNACAALVEKADPDRFAATMASPVAARQVLFPLYAFNVEVARAPWVTQESMIAEMRLQWWRDALEEIAEGASVRRHEVVTPLSRVLDRDDASRLDRLVAARRWDIYRDPFEDGDHFRRYIDETAVGPMFVAAHAIARTADVALSPDVEAALQALGHATGLARFLQAVPALEAQGRVPLLDGRSESVAQLAARALALCPTVTVIHRLLPKPVRPAVSEAFQTRALLTQAVREPRRVASGRLALNPLRRSLLLLRWS
jgi:phytoene synthase